MCRHNFAETRGARSWVAVCGFACVAGLALFAGSRKCRAADAVAVAKEGSDGGKSGARRNLFFAPTTEWLPKPQIDIPEANADQEAAMRPYTEQIPGSEVTFDVLPIRGGTFLMGSLDREPGRRPDEGPRHKVRVEPFWIGKCEVTWNEFSLWILKREPWTAQRKRTPREELVDAVTAPSRLPYDPTFCMERDGYPAVCMTQLGAKLHCRWLSAKTGRYYRLPTEAEWEYACRAGTDTTYSFGNDPEKLDQYAWYYDNSNDAFHRVGRKKPNPWGLYDMHGNVAEWVLDQYMPDFYGPSANGATRQSPFAVPKTLYPRVVRGGAWDDFQEDLRSAARRFSSEKWSEQDPLDPKMAVWHTDATFVGFRVVRPLRLPSHEECDRMEGIERDYRLLGDFERTQKLFRRWGEPPIAKFTAHADDVSKMPEGLERLIADSKSPDPVKKKEAIKELRNHERHLVQHLVFRQSDTAIEALRCMEGPRTATLDRASKLDAPEKVKKLIVNLGSSYPVVRRVAAGQLGDLGLEAVAAIPFLLNALEDDEYEADHPDDMVQQVCEGAQYALQKIGEPAVDALIDRLDSREVQARERAAELLGKMGVQRALPSLLTVLKRDDVTQAWGTVDALKRLNAEEAVEPLIELLAWDDPETRSRAASALSEFGDLRANEPLRELVIRNRETWATALVCLSRINTEGRDAVIELLQHKEPRVRRHAAFVLSRDKFPEAIDPLLKLLHDKAVQDGVAPSIDWIVEQRGIEVAVRAFTIKDATNNIRRFALVEVVRHNHPRATEFLLEALPNPDYQTRRTAIAAAKRLRLKEAVEPLIEIVRTAKYNLDRAEAAEALGEIGDRRACDALAGALSGSDSLVVTYAARGLAKLGDPRAVTPLLSLLAKDRYDTRISAAIALGEFDDPRVAPALIKAANHPDEDTRGWALLALAKVNAPGVLDTFIEALADESVRSHACAALARRDEAQIPDLVRAKLGRQDATKTLESINRIRRNIKQRESQRGHLRKATGGTRKGAA